VTRPDPTPEPAAVDPVDGEDDAPAEAEAPPANRAERRARKSGQLPGHVGPQNDETARRGGGRGPRSHTKRI